MLICFTEFVLRVYNHKYRKIVFEFRPIMLINLDLGHNCVTLELTTLNKHWIEVNTLNKHWIEANTLNKHWIEANSKQTLD